MTGESRIQREIRQSRPFAAPTAEALVALLRTTDRVRRYLAQVVEAHGITLQQYNVLRILRGAGENGLPTLEIAERMIETTPGITRLMDRLEAKAWVHRERCPRDRRQVLCRATPAALDLLQRLDAPVARADHDVMGALAPERLSVLVALLDDLRAGLDAQAALPSSPEGDRS